MTSPLTSMHHQEKAKRKTYSDWLKLVYHMLGPEEEVEPMKRQKLRGIRFKGRNTGRLFSYEAAICVLHNY